MRLLLPKKIDDMEEMNRGSFKTAMLNALDALRLVLYPCAAEIRFIYWLALICSLESALFVQIYCCHRTKARLLY